MGKPQIHSRRATLSANRARETIGESLALIRRQDDLTWKDMARVLGKSEDRAASYAAGTADMGVVSFLLGAREWNGRFTNDVFGLIGMKLIPVDPLEQTDRAFGVTIARLKLAIDEALVSKDELDETDLDDMRALLDEAGRAIDSRRGRSKLRAVD